MPKKYTEVELAHSVAVTMGLNIHAVEINDIGNGIFKVIAGGESYIGTPDEIFVWAENRIRQKINDLFNKKLTVEQRASLMDKMQSVTEPEICHREPGE